ncbi:MAG: archease [Nitrospirae bacterium]|nr:MAG: archease [Nitrospirota bacterium]
MDKDFEILDISGDVGLRVFGENLERLFINSARGLYHLITENSQIKPQRAVDVNVYADTLDGLLVGWLNELIFQFDTYGFLGADVEIKSLSENRIEATLFGEDFDPARHERGLLIKAATYHNVKIEKQNGLWSVEVIFDI